MTAQSLHWHLHHNIFPPLPLGAIQKVVDIYERYEAGEIDEETEVPVGTELITVRQLFNDLKIEA